MTKEQKQKVLSSWYENLPAKLQAQLRKELMEKTQIKRSCFYNYLQGRKEIPDYLFNLGIVPFICANKYEYTKADPKAMETEA